MKCEKVTKLNNEIKERYRKKCGSCIEYYTLMQSEQKHKNALICSHYSKINSSLNFFLISSSTYEKKNEKKVDENVNNWCVCVVY